MRIILGKVAPITATTLLTAVCGMAQSFTVLHSFAAIGQNPSTGLFTNIDGANSYARMILSGNTLYGTTTGDNTNGLGGVFRINTDGTGFTNLYAFGFINGKMTNGADGSNPFGGLILLGNRLYGTTKTGGTNFTGSVFAIDTDGTGFTNLHLFRALVSNTNADGAYPEAGLVASGDTLYGTTYSGGRFRGGTVFAINTNGTGFTNLFNFNGTNGENPQAGLIVSNNTLYGTTYFGGTGGTNGTVFALHTDGTGFTNLHSFSTLGSPYPTNSDGANPQAGLVLSGDTLYGVASRGGSNVFGSGVLFAVKTNGTGFVNLYNFTQTAGAYPYSDLFLVGTTLYGTASGGGANFAGVVFEINTDGTGFVDLYDFPAVEYNGSAYTNSAGAEPWAGVVASGNTLYGITPTGGPGGAGSVFTLSLGPSSPSPIPLNAQISQGAIVLSWTNAAFSLQASPAVTVPFTNVPGAASPFPFPISATNPQMFFRLKSN